MRNGWYINSDGIKVDQVMHNENGMQKGIRQILIERNLFKDSDGKYGLKLDCKDCKEKIPKSERQIITEQYCSRYILSQRLDFKEQDSWLVEVCKNANMSIIYYPKCTCELNFIEMIWDYVNKIITTI